MIDGANTGMLLFFLCFGMIVALWLKKEAFVYGTVNRAEIYAPFIIEIYVAVYGDDGVYVALYGGGRRVHLPLSGQQRAFGGKYRVSGRERLDRRGGRRRRREGTLRFWS